jgi:predicted nucleic acid-binding protein
MPSTVIVDTGFLVALFARDDSHHVSAKALLKGRLCEAKANLITIWPVITEAGFFLNSAGKIALLEWVNRGALSITSITYLDAPAIIALVKRYADRNIDLTDACLIWLAGRVNTSQVLTVDRKDFAIYRTPDGKAFERIWIE